MKKSVFVVFLPFVLVLFLCSWVFAGVTGKISLKVGDERYVCNCGKDCCQTISRDQANCSCGNKLIKARVTQVKEGQAYFKAEGWDKDRQFKTVGLYACSCGGNCCETISQKPGKCSCGMDLVKVN